MSPEERFWAKVDRSGDCWLWTGTTFVQGYGQFSLDGRYVKAHRYSYGLANGYMPQFLDHKCRNRRCVNPDHLRSVTKKQNAENRSGANKNSSSGVRGVSWYPRYGMWTARVGHQGRVITVGYFHTIEAAETAVVAKRRELFTHSEVDSCPGS